MINLLYPLGFVASSFFTLRFIIQWYLSEKEKQTVVPPVFWKLSMAGNGLMVVHSLIQFQFHVGVIQLINGIIAWRNLNLMDLIEKRFSLKVVMGIIGLSLFSFVSLFFLLDYYFFDSQASWFRIPSYFHENVHLLPAFWHFIGIFGMVLFSSRFWVQWWDAETRGVSALTPLFWWLSLGGAILSAVYFALIYDLVNFLGPSVGLIPYIRNLMLSKQVREV